MRRNRHCAGSSFSDGSNETVAVSSDIRRNAILSGPSERPHPPALRHASRSVQNSKNRLRRSPGDSDSMSRTSGSGKKRPAIRSKRQGLEGFSTSIPTSRRRATAHRIIPSVWERLKRRGGSMSGDAISGRPCFVYRNFQAEGGTSSQRESAVRRRTRPRQCIRRAVPEEKRFWRSMSSGERMPLPDFCIASSRIESGIAHQIWMPSFSANRSVSVSTCLRSSFRPRPLRPGEGEGPGQFLDAVSHMDIHSGRENLSR